MKFNFTSRNVAIAILLILTLILGIVSIVIATRLSQQTTSVEGTIDSHGCRTDKGEAWCDANNQCQDGTKTCGSTEPPPGSNICTVQYGGGSVTIPNVDACNGKSLTCFTYSGDSDATCSNNKSGPQTIGKGQSIHVTAACGGCAQVDCSDGGGSRVNGGACTPPPPPPPPPPPLICGDAKCKTGEICERTAAGGSIYKLCTAADITAGTAPTGAAAACIISSCTLTPVVLVCGDAKCKTGEECERTSTGASTYNVCSAADIAAGTAPTGASSDCNINSCSVNVVVVQVSVPLPSTAVISDDFDRLMIGFMFVILGALAYRFNLLNRLFKNLNTLSEEDTIKNSLQDRFLKNSRGSFEKKVEKDFENDK